MRTCPTATLDWVHRTTGIPTSNANDMGLSWLKPAQCQSLISSPYSLSIFTGIGTLVTDREIVSRHVMPHVGCHAIDTYSRLFAEPVSSIAVTQS